MTKEDKDLLLKDLSGRLPYGVKVCCYKVDYNKTPLLYDNETLVGVVGDNIITENDTFSIERVRPYLRPMSSMTKEEREETDEFRTLMQVGFEKCEMFDSVGFVDYLNSYHFRLS